MHLFFILIVPLKEIIIAQVYTTTVRKFQSDSFSSFWEILKKLQNFREISQKMTDFSFLISC